MCVIKKKPNPTVSTCSSGEKREEVVAKIRQLEGQLVTERDRSTKLKEGLAAARVTVAQLLRAQSAIVERGKKKERLSRQLKEKSRVMFFVSSVFYYTFSLFPGSHIKPHHAIAAELLRHLQQRLVKISSDTELRADLATAVDAMLEKIEEMSTCHGELITAVIRQTITSLRRDKAMKVSATAQAEYRQQVCVLGMG
jgi:uncharacterized membrane-anchored protein YjiN (DUF445 family)